MLWGLLAIVWLVLIVLSAVIYRNPRGDFETGAVYHLMRLYIHLMHRPRVSGLQHVPQSARPGPLIVVANHTSGVDPMLIEAFLPFIPRWLMDSEMALPRFKTFWEIADVIFVDRVHGDRTSVRAAIRVLEAGGVVGIFPEGELERPQNTLKPFMAGVGLILSRTGAPVLPIVIRDTPLGPDAFACLLMTSRARIDFHEPINYAAMGLGADAIMADLQRRYQEWTGWPVTAAGKAPQSL